MDLWNWDEASPQEVPRGSRLSGLEGAELGFYFPEPALQEATLTVETCWKGCCGVGPVRAGEEGLPQLDWGSALPHPEAPWEAEHAPQALSWSGDWTDLAHTGSDPWSRVPRAAGPPHPGLGPTPVAGSEGAAGQNCSPPAGGAGSWWRVQAAASSTSWDCSVGSDGAASWGQGPGEEPRADYTLSWGGPAGSDHTTSWDLGLHTDCTTASKGYQSSHLTTPSEPSQQSDRATLAYYPKTNPRGSKGRGPRLLDQVKGKRWGSGCLSLRDEAAKLLNLRDEGPGCLGPLYGGIWTPGSPLGKTWTFLGLSREPGILGHRSDTVWGQEA
ncbi:ETS translocation variant 2 isoform X3 [Diceros bicornis minor]|uniref:ETS translocation variant 2 isoform X3 n=1 Tax=Diceros bicornis minor TaxID=77932 RepID=UPI0026EEDDAD|nr:ETS translocation variant 2 isoform X3 [Diceros bicornis minor]